MPYVMTYIPHVGACRVRCLSVGRGRTDRRATSSIYAVGLSVSPALVVRVGLLPDVEWRECEMSLWSSIIATDLTSSQLKTRPQTVTTIRVGVKP